MPKPLSPAPSPFLGKWLGVLNEEGEKIKVALEILVAKPGDLQATYHNIFADETHQPLISLTLAGNRLQVQVDPATRFEGVIGQNGQEIRGQLNGKVPLTLRRVQRIPFRPRPQTPKAPFPYLEENVCYPSGEHRLAGTLTYPDDRPGPFPAILLVAGSGKNNRNASSAGHKPFLVLADHLTRQGWAVLRTDKRGVGQSTGDFEKCGMEEFAFDVLAGVNYLKTRTEIHPDHIGLLGHSEGGSVAPLAAIQSSDIGFLILVGASGQPEWEVMVAQDCAQARLKGKSEAEVTLIEDFSRRFFTTLMHAKTPQNAKKIIRQLYSTLTKAEQKALGHPNLRGMRDLTPLIGGPAFWKELAFDIRPTLEQVKCPVLALGGSQDTVVPTPENLAGIAAALQRGGNTLFTTLEIPNLNHMMRTCKADTAQKRTRTTDTLAPVVLQVISDWLFEWIYPARDAMFNARKSSL